MTRKMAQALNKQVNAEFFAAYLYLAMSADADQMGLKGTAHWFALQAQEETTHALRIYNYLLRTGQKVNLDAIEKPKGSFKSMKGLFEAALGHEKKVTAMIQNLASLAQTEKDFATGIEMQWFVSEQIEEEENVNEILNKIQLAHDAPGAVFMIDNELAGRAQAPAAAVAE